MKQLIICNFLCLFLSGCIVNWQGNIYQEKMLYDKLIAYQPVIYNNYKGDEKIIIENVLQISNIENKIKSNEFCVVNLFGIIPINLGDIKFTDEEIINHAMKRLKKEDSHIKGLLYIEIKSVYTNLLVFGKFCREVSGLPIY